MGTQQILLIVLVILVIAIASAAGITAFFEYAYNSNKTAIISDSQLYAAWILQYYKTSKTNGGLGGTLEGVSSEDIIRYLGGDRGKFVTDNGTYTVEITDEGEDLLKLIGTGSIGRRGKIPKVITSVELVSGTIRSEVSDE